MVSLNVDDKNGNENILTKNTYHLNSNHRNEKVGKFSIEHLEQTFETFIMKYCTFI